MAEETEYPDPVYTSGAGTARLPEPRAVVSVSRGGKAVRVGKRAGTALGTAVRMVKSGRSHGNSMDKKQMVGKAEDFIRNHPGTLAGAGVAGFVLGLLIQGRQAASRR